MRRVMRRICRFCGEANQIIESCVKCKADISLSRIWKLDEEKIDYYKIKAIYFDTRKLIDEKASFLKILKNVTLLIKLYDCGALNIEETMDSERMIKKIFELVK